MGQEFAEAARNGGSHNIDVIPLPLPSGELPRLWAFVTIVNNNTQEMTVQRPQ